ncbi:hypothetical protein PsYK624_145340 [Phanerochaete sordida]|uniref:Uncharacterized protein n=1 Tax=Phanerochaete sordida TaxID=48140 RepID=A0A9P3LLH4_9APHY|nr:hypothetical protein PsYK624_145340 [Phanerochaete sordida]
MEDCPVELWMKIAGYACTDGGHTGCALSLVSRTMYRVVQPVRYYTVSLVGKKRLFAFSAQCGALNLPPRVHHLLIAKVSIPCYPPDDTLQLQVNIAVRTVLAQTAPYLCSLHIVGWEIDSAADLPIFPRLRDITLPDAPYQCAPHTHTHFPSLRRLHLLSIASAQPQFWLDVMRFAPHLTHLRLSNLTRGERLCPFLRALLDTPPTLRDTDAPGAPAADETFAPGSEAAMIADTVAARLAALRRVYVQPGLYRCAGWYGSGPVDFGEMMSGLQDIASVSARDEGEKRLSLLPDQTYCVDEVRKGWQDMVEGGDGPWLAGHSGAGGSS